MTNSYMHPEREHKTTKTGDVARPDAGELKRAGLLPDTAAYRDAVKEGKNLLYSFSWAGNMQQAASTINERFSELVDHVISLSYGPGDNTTVVVRLPATLLLKLRQQKRL